MKVWIVMGMWEYEGPDILFVASSEELASKYVEDNFEMRSPYPEDKHWKELTKVIPKQGFGYYDYIEIEEFSVDETNHSGE